MRKARTDPREVGYEVIADCEHLFGDDLISVLIYGSVASGEYRHGSSDINFMIVLTEEGIEHLDRVFEAVGKWRKSRAAVPLFITQRYLETSLDVFPIEYLNFLTNHVLLYGKDILEGLVIKPEFLRLQCERELKGKLMLLRAAFVGTQGKSGRLKHVVSESLPAMVATFRALLYLKGREGRGDQPAILRETCEVFGLEHVVFQNLLDIRRGKLKRGDRDLLAHFKAYLGEVRKLSDLVDQLGE
jgi:predicted nucleotidyltransferase